MCARDDDTATGGETATNVLPFRRRPRATATPAPYLYLSGIAPFEWCAREAFELGWRAGNAAAYADTRELEHAHIHHWQDLAPRTVLRALHEDGKCRGRYPEGCANGRFHRAV